MRIDVFFHETHEIEQQLALILKGQTDMAIDTSKILAAVAAERTELKSWETLAAQLTAAITKLAADLAAAIAANDPAAIAQVQADLDKAATDLSADNAEAAAAITANTPAAP